MLGREGEEKKKRREAKYLMLRRRWWLGFGWEEQWQGQVQGRGPLLLEELLQMPPWLLVERWRAIGKERVKGVESQSGGWRLEGLENRAQWCLPGGGNSS